MNKQIGFQKGAFAATSKVENHQEATKPKKARLVPLSDYLIIEAEDPKFLQTMLDRAQEAAAIIGPDPSPIPLAGQEGPDKLLDLEAFESYLLLGLCRLQTIAEESPTLENISLYELVAYQYFYDRFHFIRNLATKAAHARKDGQVEPKISQYYEAAQENFEVLWFHLRNSQELLLGIASEVSPNTPIG